MKAFVLCGEPSGDLYAWLLLKNLDLELYGIGGERLTPILRKSYGEIGEFGVFGLDPKGVLRSIHQLTGLKRCILDLKPDLFLPVAYPGLNLPLVRIIRRAGIRVLYLIPPQIWAWGFFRRRFLSGITTVSLFPFERRYLNGVETVYIGNPLIDFLAPYRKIKPIPDLIGLLPGSRPGIIRRHLAYLIRIAERLRKRYRFRIFTRGYPVPDFIEVYQGDRYQGMRECSRVVVKLGTGSLEAAILGIPQIAFYLPGRLDHLLRPLITTQEFSIVNMILGRRAISYRIGADVETIISDLENVSQEDLFPALKERLLFEPNRFESLIFSYRRGRAG